MCKRHSFFVQFYRKKERYFVQKDVRYNMCDLFKKINTIYCDDIREQSKKTSTSPLFSKRKSKEFACQNG